MDKNTAINFIEDTFSARFDESRFILFIKNLLNDVEPKSNAYSGNYIWDDHKEHINSYKRIGKYTDPEGDALDVLIIEVKSITKLERARTSLRNFVIKHLSKFDKDYALAAFYSKEDGGSDWRFSFIKLEYQSYLDEEKQKIKTRKEYTPAKRYSFLVGEYEKAYTAKNQLLPLLQNVSSNPTLEELEDAFSIEKVTDEFFLQYKDLYIKLFEHFENDQHIQTELVKANIDNARFTKKLLGQIVFLYFLQKKGWLGVPKAEHWGKGNKQFIQELFYISKEQNQNFFKDYLQYLFYEALAKERNDENSYYKRFNCRIPFLNGGLFEAEYDWQNANISIPVNLFRNTEKNKAGDLGTGVLDVFDRYNFTIKEDEPLDKEVAVDPEMLGKVFENMLDITERKSKGAFYTPREIVHYMCQESLIHYLDNSLEGKVKKVDIETYIRKGHFALENDQRVANKGRETKDYKYIIPESIRKNADLIDQKLSEIRILDPAIGSGAFPVGLLHELVNAQMVIKPHLTHNYLKHKLDNFGFQFHESVHESRYIYRLKRHIIQENIYGVDIDASAIDIARLRLWLSLVVDEDDLDPIETLPNLDYKIVCGNSLIGMPENSFRDLQVEKELEVLKQQFYDETNEDKKKELRTQINSKIRELLDSAETFAGYKIDFDFKLYFSEVWYEKGGFDVVIGNPPYVESKKLPLEVKRTFKKYDSATGKFDLYVLFIEKGLKITNKKASLIYINPTTFLTKQFGSGLRALILKGYKIKEIIDFADIQVFSGATNYTGIFHLINEICSDYTFDVIQYSNINRSVGKEEFKSSLTYNMAFEFRETIQIKSAELNSNNWVFISQKLNNVIKRITYSTKPLKDFVQYIFVGIQSGKDKVFFVKQDDISEWHLEMDLIHPILKGKDVRQYNSKWSGTYVIYPYDENNEVIREDKLSNNFPNIYKYLTKNKFKLRGRAYFDRSEKEWYELWCERIMSKFKQIKIVNAEISPENRFNIDSDGFLGNTKIFSTVLMEDYNDYYHYFLALLNSEVLNFYHIQISSKKAGGFYDYKTQYIEKYPIQINTEFKNILSAVTNYLLFLYPSKHSYDILTLFFKNLSDALVYEVYFREEMIDADKQILHYLVALKPITDEMSKEEKLAIIQSEFERLYDPNHPVRNNLETLDSIEEVRIIKEALK
jgi:hypothetical protein